MIDYKKILENDFIKEEYRKIDSINPYPFNHGLRHINNVCSIMNKLCDIFKIYDDKREALLISCALHDVGQYNGRENHGLKARNIAIKLFDKELKENKYYNDILNAIEDHDNSCSIKYPLFTLLVQFADKMDFTKSRLETWYREKYEYRIWEDMNSVDYIYDTNFFGINILANDVDDIVKQFYEQSFTFKIMNAVKELAKKLNKKPIIKINNKEININNYIVVHGSFGSSESNWFPWLKNEIEKLNVKIDVPNMPIGVDNQNYFNWEKEFDKQLIDEDTVIIAHSIAPIFVCKYLINKHIKVKKLIFVCGFNNYIGINEEYDRVNKPMFIDNYKDIKNYCDNIVCYYSDNDPYVPFSIEKKFAQDISNKQIMIPNGGHINSESGYTSFEQILSEI